MVRWLGNSWALPEFLHYYLVRDIKPPNDQSGFPQIFLRISQFQHLKKKTNLSLVQNQEKPWFGTIKSSFSFSTPQAEKNSWKKLEKTRLVVWWFDVTNKVFSMDEWKHECIQIRMHHVHFYKKVVLSLC